MFKNFDEIPQVFESKLRIQILSYLHVAPTTFSDIKKMCSYSDGKIVGQLNVLIKEGYIIQKKEIVDNKPRSTYTITKFGNQQLLNYIEFIKSLTEND